VRQWRAVTSVAAQLDVLLGAADEWVTFVRTFSSPNFHRWLLSPPMLTKVSFSPMIRVGLSESFPKLVE
jgi:hypothetical protein